MDSHDGHWKPASPEYSKSDFDVPWMLIHFWATWNLIDRKMDETLLQLGLPESIVVRSCDIDSQPELAIKSRVGNIPALALFYHGNRVETLIGLHDPEYILNWLDRHIQQNEAFEAKKGNE
tara:strand:+ start:80134 stop:80496 length:363 start_codon:yes stop_codon:yes gene_type:complete